MTKFKQSLFSLFKKKFKNDSVDVSPKYEGCIGHWNSQWSRNKVNKTVHRFSLHVGQTNYYRESGL